MGGVAVGGEGAKDGAGGRDERGAPAFVPRCLGCGYDLSGLADGKCPECGRAFTYAELRARQADALIREAMPFLCGTWLVPLVVHGSYLALGAQSVALVSLLSGCSLMVEVVLARMARQKHGDVGAIAAFVPVIHAIVGVIVVAATGHLVMTACAALVAAMVHWLILSPFKSMLRVENLLGMVSIASLLTAFAWYLIHGGAVRPGRTMEITWSCLAVAVVSACGMWAARRRESKVRSTSPPSPGNTPAPPQV